MLEKWFSQKLAKHFFFLKAGWVLILLEHNYPLILRCATPRADLRRVEVGPDGADVGGRTELGGIVRGGRYVTGLCHVHRAPLDPLADFTIAATSVGPFVTSRKSARQLQRSRYD